MCIPLDRRLQLLIDESRYRRVAADARARGISVGAAIREAIDARYPSDLDRKREAWERIKAAPPVDLPDSVEELEREIEELYGGGA